MTAEIDKNFIDCIFLLTYTKSMRKIAPQFFLAISAFIQACTSVHQYKHEPKNNDGEIVFYRKSKIKPGSIAARVSEKSVVFLDGNNILKLRPSDYASVKVNPGLHEIGASGDSSAQYHKQSVIIRDFQTLYFKIDMNPTAFKAKVALAPFAFFPILNAVTQISTAASIPQFQIQPSSRDEFREFLELHKNIIKTNSPDSREF
jgi:hypothetical protein